ncbi:MAG TPA: PASTA domain-containing protein [Gaiellaceae bacterium]|jgi:hypothetical protein
MYRKLVAASAIAAVAAAACLTGSGVASSAAAAREAQRIPAGLAAAIHTRFGAGAIRSARASRASAGPTLGFSVALSADGTTALVGAPGDFKGPGAAFVFHSSSAGAWSSTDTPAATLLYTTHPAKGVAYGIDVALSADGTTAFVGAADGGFTAGSGTIYVFHASAEDAWASSSTPAASLTDADNVVGDGFAVSADGTTLIAGTPLGAGGANIFHVSSETAWASTSTPTATLTNAAQPEGDQYAGISVAISADGTTALVSDAGNANGGDAYVYRVAAEDAWADSSTPTAFLSNANSVSGDLLGYSVSLSGDGTVATLAAPGFGSSPPHDGSIDIFRTSEEAAWATTSSPTAILTDGDGGLFGNGFGGSAAVSSDGTTVLASVPFYGGLEGGVDVFHVSNTAAWASTDTPTAILVNSGRRFNEAVEDSLPPALSADGTTALDGTPYQDSGTGAADVFHVSDAGSWKSTSKAKARLTVKALERCVVPRLIGLKLRAAKSVLKARSCRLGNVRRVHAKLQKGRVLSQSRKPGTRLPVGTKVSVKVGE